MESLSGLWVLYLNRKAVTSSADFLRGFFSFHAGKFFSKKNLVRITCKARF